MCKKTNKNNKYFTGISLSRNKGHQNALLAGLMTATVILPRVLTAKKRNPDNKEATRDEVKEILFRDVQTVLIILFIE